MTLSPDLHWLQSFIEYWSMQVWWGGGIWEFSLVPNPRVPPGEKHFSS